MITDNATTGKAHPHDLALMAKTDRPAWAAELLHAIPRDNYVRLKHFLNRRHRSHHGVVAFKDINRFISRTPSVKVDWNSLLRICEQMGELEEHYWRPDFWMDPSRKQGVAFVAVDRNLLISRGLYKTALARFALHYKDCDTLYGVKVSRWSVDWEMYETWLKLTRICAEHYPQFAFLPEKKHIAKARQGNWVVDDYLLKLRREDRNSGEVSILGVNEARDWLGELENEVEAPELSLANLKAHAMVA